MPGSDRLGVQAWRYLLISILVIGVDQWSKWLAEHHLSFGERINVMPGFDWTLAYNTGVAFSMFADGEAWQRYGLAGFAILVSGVFIWMLAGLQRAERIAAIAYALIIGGALGNVIDRIRHGHVVDFVLWYVRDYYWPAFNVADSCIVVGAGLLLLFGWRHKEPSAPAKV
ncbi:signal peptidase II [Ahniella affigens]|uniref:signal peptidase II n=1 Tax=Ahniella affigens TaxID=2021234 RepID=UPI001F0BED75|nr:signal peptidase II [Ahniella affigens]